MGSPGAKRRLRSQSLRQGVWGWGCYQWLPRAGNAATPLSRDGVQQRRDLLGSRRHHRHAASARPTGPAAHWGLASAARKRCGRLQLHQQAILCSCRGRRSFTPSLDPRCPEPLATAGLGRCNAHWRRDCDPPGIHGMRSHLVVRRKLLRQGGALHRRLSGHCFPG